MVAARRSKAPIESYCRPASQCCCGCSLEFGVKAILFLGLLRSVLVIFMAVTTLVFKSPYFEFTGSSATQIFNAALAMGGVPLALAALWAVFAKFEAPIRLYVHYMVTSLGVDIFFIVKDMIISGPCQNLPTLAMQNGAAFACGMARVFNSVTIFVIMGVQMYFIFVLLSYCEEVKMAGGPDLSDLAYYNDPKRRLNECTRAGGSYDAIQEYGINLESGQQILGGSTAIFGKSHELRYPPPGAQ